MKKKYRNKLPKDAKVKGFYASIENGELTVDVEFDEFFKPKDGTFLVDTYGDVFIINAKLSTPPMAGCYVGYVKRTGEWIYGKENIFKAYRFTTEGEEVEFLLRLRDCQHKYWNAHGKKLIDIINPKEGDVLVCGGFLTSYTMIYASTTDGAANVFVVRSMDNHGNVDWDYNVEHLSCLKNCRYATDQEKTEFLKLLKEERKQVWDNKNKCVQYIG